MKRIIKKLINKIYLRTLLQKTNYAHLGEHKLIIPPRHELFYCLNIYPLYDKYLPILSKYLDNKKDIIDVGANIGDTAISLLSNSEAHIHCFEYSKYFINFFKKSISYLDKKTADRISIYQGMVGTGKYKGEIKREKGTASLEITSKIKSQFKKIDEFTFPRKISLLKVDIDGFDFDVLESASNLIGNSKPILFWENQIFEQFQNDEFKKIYSFLSKKGYSIFYVFDNFGNLMLENANINNLSNLSDYISNMEIKKNTRTLYYVDILACQKKDHPTVEKSILDFKKKFNLF